MDKKAELELKKAKLEQIRKKKAAGLNESPNSSQTQFSAEAANLDPEKILIECGITTPVLLSSLVSPIGSIGSKVTDDPNSPHFQHQFVPGQSRNIFKRYFSIQQLSYFFPKL
jgi:hypothetical protein